MSGKNDKTTRSIVKAERIAIIGDYLRTNREYVMVAAVRMWAAKPLRDRLAICIKILRGDHAGK